MLTRFEIINYIFRQKGDAIKRDVTYLQSKRCRANFELHCGIKNTYNTLGPKCKTELYPRYWPKMSRLLFNRLFTITSIRTHRVKACLVEVRAV